MDPNTTSQSVSETPAPAAVPAQAQPQSPAPATSTSAPVTAPAAPTISASAVTSGCKCLDININEWDKQKKQLNKTFYKTFSPRLFYYPFSFAIDMNRAVMGATAKGYKEVQNPMVMDSNPKMFWSTLLVEVADAKADDPSVVSFAGKNLYTKVSRKPWKKMGEDIAELVKELGVAPKELYVWYTSCPACTDKKEAKSVLIAVI